MIIDHRPPSIPRFLREFAAFADLRLKTYRLPAQLDEAVEPSAAQGALPPGPPVIVLPGFLASDFSTRPFRAALAAAGLRVHGWGLGLNSGAQADTLEQLDGVLDRFAPDQPAILVGWSFGGLMARELAKRHPDRVLRVITLGSPISGNRRANHLWRTYEKVTGYSLDTPPLSVRLHEKPPVETIAIWSSGDGIVAPACQRGQPGETDRLIEVTCTHVGFMTCRKVMGHILGLIDEVQAGVRAPADWTPDASSSAAPRMAAGRA